MRASWRVRAAAPCCGCVRTQAAYARVLAAPSPRPPLRDPGRRCRWCAAAHAPREGRPDFPAEGGVGTPGAKVHFSVMHVVQPNEAPSEVDRASAPQRAAGAKDNGQDAGMEELMHHTDDMLRDDNAELDQVWPSASPPAVSAPSLCAVGRSGRGLSMDLSCGLTAGLCGGAVRCPLLLRAGEQEIR